ncbi:serine/threonine-protein phosphatase [Microbacterium trichothecenolyticum]|uniref:Serine/threonine-protein phosphatase n=1 Tax=Microbacterium ureisolvens TaxID=2781186 RepID=A0ABS7HX36_9MICO|nr:MULTISPECIES: protein phosphatase 2C domain-containing protein [Microbacterium]MBW9108823.1 serine/threonine-protein phosphatase [Microbacterium ureisolvens]MBW9120661.1 serine/threonine-protein phosphatase [Microbacterium trichothecenolyticum]
MTGPRALLRAVAGSDIGPHRATNQDAAFAASWGAAVADGVGGGPAGDLASAAFIHRLAAGRLDGLDPVQLADAVRAANWDLRAHVERDPSLSGMATTFTGLFAARDGGLLLAHTGDSRAYRLRDGELAQASRDDSLVQALVDRGIVSITDAASHPRRNIITASLSGAERDAATVTAFDAQLGDRWLLCSDGLTDYVPDAEIRAILVASPHAETAVEACVAVALEAGSQDNVTVVVCDVVDAADEIGGAPTQTSFYGAAADRFMEGLESA